MPLHALTHRQHDACRVRRAQWRHVRQRRRRRRPEQVLENPLAADDRRRPIGIRRHRQNASLSEQTAPLAVRRERHAPEVLALDVRNAVVRGQALVDERVVGAQQIERAAILAHDALEEELRLATERLPEGVVEIGEHALHRDDGVEVSKEQPLSREVADEGVRSRVGHHAANLARKHRGLAQLTLVARFSNSSSGTLLHRKNERRDASSTSLIA